MGDELRQGCDVGIDAIDYRLGSVENWLASLDEVTKLNILIAGLPIAMHNSTALLIRDMQTFMDESDRKFDAIIRELKAQNDR